ncbi:hypothetical protein LZZ85_01330 [Terrimonas sp. NA20]|uniref:Uncharacterized protein n=1 Tax=Terrimonas ginsenosidimutans TaxID=2908004 RepID=A0ABS9KKP7_9BACT|nr:hypothetical protein [Terrimonas ginsenosidimutans]MCG2612893.1 hypothetical protein [Terrimonas ginsenosidimutans]
MKFILHTLSLLFLSAVCFAQDNTFFRNIPTDTTVRTAVETVLRQKNSHQKVEYIDGASIGGIYYSIIVVQNMTTGAFEKGVYVNSDSWPNTYSFNNRTTPHAYIDDNELSGLISFFENCDSIWKKETPDNRTSYEYESLDGFRVSFGAGSMSAGWRFAFQFRNYQMYFTETTGKGKSVDLLYMFRSLKTKIDKIADPGVKKFDIN